MERRTARGTPYRIARSLGVRPSTSTQAVKATRFTLRCSRAPRRSAATATGCSLGLAPRRKGNPCHPPQLLPAPWRRDVSRVSRATVVYSSGSVDEWGGVREDGLPIVRRKGRLTMRRRVCGVAAAAVLAGIISAPPALAHGGHASCGEGARAFVVAQAHAGTAGETASAQAREGTLNENVAAAHAIFCEPK